MDVEALTEAIKSSNGNLHRAAKAIGVSVRTIYNYRDSHTEVAEAIDESRVALNQQILDTAESKLLEAIEDGDPWSIKLALTTKGKDRGYTEKKEVEHTGAKQIIMQMDIAPADGETDDEYGDAPE